MFTYGLIQQLTWLKLAKSSVPKTAGFVLVNSLPDTVVWFRLANGLVWQIKVWLRLANRSVNE